MNLVAADGAGSEAFEAAPRAAIEFEQVPSLLRQVQARKGVKPEDYEFSVLLGDFWTNPSSDHGADKVFRSMETYIRLLNAAEKPMLFIRGNHETIGNFADKMAYLFDMPGLKPAAEFAEQNWFCALRAGPVWFVALDGGDDFTKRYELFQPLRQRQDVRLYLVAM